MFVSNLHCAGHSFLKLLEEFTEVGIIPTLQTREWLQR